MVTRHATVAHSLRRRVPTGREESSCPMLRGRSARPACRSGRRWLPRNGGSDRIFAPARAATSSRTQFEFEPSPPSPSASRVQETLGSNSNRIHRLHRPSRTGNPWFEFEPSFPAPERDLVGAQAASTLRYREIQLSAYRESSDLLRRTLECARGASARRACCGGNGARFEVRCGAAIAPSLTSISEASARTWPRG